MPSEETGLLTLIDGNQLPEVPYLPPWQTWSDARDSIAALTNDKHDFRALAIDTGNSLEKLCHAYVCEREYGGDWGKKGFASYMQGYDVALNDWRLLLADLDSLREQRKMSIIMLCHSKVETFKNPEGPDYDRYQPAMHRKTWEITHRWADVILFGQFQAFAEGDKRKATGGQQRVIYTQRHAAYDAGNRYGLPEEIDCGDSAKEAWANFSAAMKAAKSKGGA